MATAKELLGQDLSDWSDDEDFKADVLGAPRVWCEKHFSLWNKLPKYLQVKLSLEIIHESMQRDEFKTACAHLSEKEMREYLTNLPSLCCTLGPALFDIYAKYEVACVNTKRRGN